MLYQYTSRNCESPPCNMVTSAALNVFTLVYFISQGCRSLRGEEPGYICNDADAKVRYVSSQEPHQDELFSVLRQACIRSLSSEVCSNINLYQSACRSILGRFIIGLHICKVLKKSENKGLFYT